jgi:ABC-type phosphate transport system auxiliary subunit
MDAHEFTAEQEAAAARIEDIVMGAARSEVRQMARLLVSRQNRELFGQTEFVVRDAMHRVGARAFDAALAERKKGGTKGRRKSARTAAKTPGSTATDPVT